MRSEERRANLRQILHGKLDTWEVARDFNLAQEVYRERKVRMTSCVQSRQGQIQSSEEGDSVGGPPAGTWEGNKQCSLTGMTD